MVSKTRDKLIEVARQLFYNKGVENTTMNDIAAASEKGRRTIYTYFKSKKEIYNAVVESQSNVIIDRLKDIVDLDMPYPDRLRTYLHERFEVVKDTTPHPKTMHDRYKSLFNRDSKRYEKIFDATRKKEQELFQTLLTKGVVAGAFDRDQADKLPTLMSMIYTTTDNMSLHSTPESENDLKVICDSIVEFVTNGVSKMLINGKPTIKLES